MDRWNSWKNIFGFVPFYHVDDYGIELSFSVKSSEMLWSIIIKYKEGGCLRFYFSEQSG